MDIRIDLESSVPIYMQIVEQIRHLVARGRCSRVKSCSPSVNWPWT